MLGPGHRFLQLEEGKVVVECPGDVAAVDHHPLHVPLYVALGFYGAGEIVVSQHYDKWSQESVDDKIKCNGIRLDIYMILYW